MSTFGGIRQAVSGEQGSSLVEFAISLPLLVVFIVGIYDFSGAFNQKQKIEQAAQLGAIVAASSPTGDIEVANGDPDSLQPVVTVVYNSLADANVLPLAGQGTCKPVPRNVVGHANLTWTYTISPCGPQPSDTLTIKIDRGWVPTGNTTPVSVGSEITVSYPYHWQFNSVIQLLFPGDSYSATTQLSEIARVHNQN